MSRRLVVCCLMTACACLACVTPVPEVDGHERAIAEAEENGVSTVPTTSAEPRVAYGQRLAKAPLPPPSTTPPPHIVGQATGREGPAVEVTITGSYFTAEPRPAQTGPVR